MLVGGGFDRTWKRGWAFSLRMWGRGRHADQEGARWGEGNIFTQGQFAELATVACLLFSSSVSTPPTPRQ